MRPACYNGDVTRNRALLAGTVLLFIAVAMSVWAYPLLPDRVPTHWNLAGQVNGYSSRVFAVSFVPALLAVTWVLMLVLPAISPRGFSLGESAGTFYIAMLAMLALLCVVHWMILRSAVTHEMPSLTILLASVGALFVVLGVLVTKAKKNFWFGMRTPWTLASDEVWARTNQFGGRLMVAGGALTMLASFWHAAGIAVLVVTAVVIGFAPIVYSYVVYRRIEGFDSEG